MPTFAYRVKDTDGRDQEGWLEADSEDALIQLLHQQGKVILAIERQEIARRRKGVREVPLRFVEPRVGTSDLVYLATQLSTMVDAGLPLLRCVKVLTRESDNLRLRRTLADVSTRLEAGSALSHALAEHGIFSNLFVSLVRAGEISGRLNETLKQLARYMDNVENLRKKVRNVLAYPAFLLSFSLVVLMILVLWLIPAFSRVYDRFQARIPGPTRLLMEVSQGVRDHMVVILVVGSVLGVGTWVFLRTERGRYLKDLFLMQIPKLGSLLLKSALARFARTLGVLVGSGIPFLDAMELTTQATDHRVLRRALQQTGVAIQGGSTIATAMEGTGVFPGMILSMIASGEEVGALPEMLLKAADFYDQQVDHSITGLMSLLEPLIILLLGGMIGGILLVMYLPVFTLGRAIR